MCRGLNSLFNTAKIINKAKKGDKKFINTVLYECRVGIRYVRDSVDLSFVPKEAHYN